MSRITEIKANLERIKSMDTNSMSNKKYEVHQSLLRVTLTENIKEADAMILFCDNLSMVVDQTVSKFLLIEKEDWQNLKAFLQNSLDSQSSSKKELESLR